MAHEGDGPVTNVDELRDAITHEYEDVRALFRQLRADDLTRRTDAGPPIWRLAMELALAPDREVRAARRIADGKSPLASPASAPLTAIANLRRRRVFARATRADFLTAWENGFNELFSCINDLAAESPDENDERDEAARAAALEYLRQSIDRLRADARSLRRALPTSESGAQ